MESVLLAAVVAWFLSLRLRTYLQYFQQEEYDFGRFVGWWAEARAVDRWASVGLIVLLPFAWLQPAAMPLAVGVWLFWRGRQEPDATQQGKKPLVLTPRAGRLWLMAGLVVAPLAAALSLWLPHAGPWGVIATLLLVQAVPLALGLANGLLWPLQQWQNRRYLQEATATLQRLNPTVVSLSGAFGKTSTKYFLHAILAAHAPTLLSPGSTNTALGLARIVRERLQPHHQYFLAEMGAYRVGSIAKLCALFPPHACATTAIGPAHLERFGSVAQVAAAEFEVVHATLARGGPVVLSVDCIPDDLWQPLVADHPQIRLVTARKELLRDGDYYLKQATATPQGLQLAIEHRGQLSAVGTQIHGATMAPNLATAFALATELGVPKTTSLAALKAVRPAPHRLAVRQEGALTILDDSYNSNPAGFATALETLALLGKGQRKILITPGMVELGPLHDAEHARLGALAANTADVVLAVAPARIPTFVQAIQASGQARLQLVPTFQAALGWLQQHAQPGDVVLLENDLPDRYEAKWNL
ncbi:MAG: UDP-N-acetylmuramoyl-tripeptide--D-alanyl-D-alanine ligase [Alphaproteobacteria bacterium]|nr:UDP-N-acetylmuramoyl-tripeptide--D-alanyl-D-alanine ligase [Alphaproteobacteria bacterium]